MIGIEERYHMNKKISLLLIVAMALISVACGSDKSVVGANAEGDIKELASMQAELESMEKEFEELKNSVQKLEESYLVEHQSGDSHVEEKEEGFTIAIDPVVVPDPSTQSDLVIEVTAENFLSIFEFIAINQYDSWGDYTSKLCGFSSLLYEQGWAIGRLEDFGVEYDVFDYDKLISIGVTAGKLDLSADENAEAEVRIYRAKGTLTCYPIEDVNDTERLSDEKLRYFMRVLPDGSEVEIVTDVDGIMVY